jgi:hypothetical protein
MEVDRIDLAATVTEEEFNSLFGSNPRFTGNLTTQEFINFERGRVMPCMPHLRWKCRVTNCSSLTLCFTKTRQSSRPLPCK